MGTTYQIRNVNVQNQRGNMNNNTYGIDFKQKVMSNMAWRGNIFRCNIFKTQICIGIEKNLFKNALRNAYLIFSFRE